jgi:hypothetical protein
MMRGRDTTADSGGGSRRVVAVLGGLAARAGVVAVVVLAAVVEFRSRLWPGRRAAAWALVVGVGVVVVGTGAGPIADGGVASAERVDYVDDFEDDDLDEYEVSAPAGVTVTTSTDRPYDGSRSVKIDKDNTDADQGNAVSMNGLPRYPQPGDTFRAFYYTENNDGIHTLKFGVQDTTDEYRYEVDIDIASGTDLHKVDENGYTDLDSTNTVPASNQWVEIEVAWQRDGTMNVTIYDANGNTVTTLSASDTEFRGGGIGFRSYNRDSTDTTYWDGIEITSTTTTNGQVTDADGNVLEDATVTAFNTSTGAVADSATSTVAGEYALSLESGEYDIRANKSGYGNETKTVTVPAGGTTVDFTLSSDISITDPDPPDGATVSEPPVQLSVLANSTNQSVQSIDVEFYKQENGSVDPATDTQIGSTTVAPGERAEVSWDPPPGTYEWYAVGTADSGARDTGGPYTLGVGEADIIDGSERPPDGANVPPTDNVDLAVDVRVDDNATVEFYDYETGNPDNDPLIGSQSVSSGTSTASTRWYSDERDANEEWYVVLKDSTGTRDTAGAFSFGAGGQVVARDAETGQIIDDRTVRFDTTYPGGSETFDRTPANLDLSKSSAEAGDRIRIDVQAQNYYPTTVEVANKQADADIYLERGSNYSSSPSNDDPENTASVENDPDRYLSRFELQDRTGRYPPPNTTLALKTDVDDDGQTDLVHKSSFGAANRVGARVRQDRQYQLIITNDDGDERRLGAWTALGDQLVTLQVRAFDFDIPEAGGGYVSQASVEEGDNDTERFKWQFSDPDEATSRLEVAIYEQDNRSNGLLNQTYTDLGNASFTQQLTGNQTDKAWVVELNGTRNGEAFSSREVVGETDLAPGIPLDPFYQEMFAVLLLLVLAGVFGGVRAETGAIIVPMTAGVLFWMGWLPGVVTAGAIAAALFVAVLYRIRSTPQPGVR